MLLICFLQCTMHVLNRKTAFCYEHTAHVSADRLCNLSECNAGLAETLLKDIAVRLLKDGAVKTIFILTAGVQRNTKRCL